MNQKNKRLWQITAVLAINLILLVAVSVFNAEAAKLGDSGERIAMIQRELQKMNLFDKEPDGLFDFETRREISAYGDNITDFDMLFALGLDSDYSECFSSRTELLARCIQHSGCRTYPEMLRKGCEILEMTDGALTLGKYVSLNFSDFESFSAEPTCDAYNAAIQAIRKTAL